jgi:hypothetical protein
MSKSFRASAVRLALVGVVVVLGAARHPDASGPTLLSCHGGRCGRPE